MVLNLEEEYRYLTKLDTKFSSRVEERLKRFRDAAPYRAPLGAAEKRAADHLANVRAKNPDQWQFYKGLRILNPANLSSMSHDISLCSTLCLPLADPEFMCDGGSNVAEKDLPLQTTVTCLILG